MVQESHLFSVRSNAVVEVEARADIKCRCGVHGLSACAHELTAMRNQLTELGFQLGGASVLHGDNTASIDAARHPGKHRSALRHLELHAFAIRDLIREERASAAAVGGHEVQSCRPADESGAEQGAI